ncbi:MAG TPA: ferrochelatase [Cyclobacteriaceae bacterium]|nr:ferrochelatase [Cyclobacteriaceae bacterium]
MAGAGNNSINGSVAVVLLQLGGPDSLAAVEPFLYNLFSDPEIIDFPFARLARPTLARLISSRRAKHVQKHYESIGGKSPIRERTDQQARALEDELRKTLNARVFVAMRYWHPLTLETIEKITAQDFRELVLLPLYPQYSKTTTGSSLNEWRRKYATAGKNGLSTRIVKEFYQHPVYIEAVVEKINQGLERFFIANKSDSLRDELAESPSFNEAGLDIHLVFSAHGVPLSVIEAGDPYQAQIEATVGLVMERGGWRNRHHLCYQSRVGPGRWLQPSLDEELKSLAAQGVERTLVIPIAFVSDHVETLSEIDIEARDLAGHLGIKQFEVMPALNDSPRFIQALAELVLQAIGHS